MSWPTFTQLRAALATVPLYAWNLISIIAVGTLVLAWCMAFTEWLDVIGTLLAFGGILSWLAFTFRVVGEERQKKFREWLEDHLLVKNRTWKWCLCVFGIWIFVFSGCGVVQVEVVQSGSDAIVHVYDRDDPGLGEADRVAAGKRERYLRFTPPWGSVVRVKPAGLPGKEIRLLPWWIALSPEKLSVSGSFVQPLVLVAADASLVASAVDSKLTLEILIDGKSASKEDFDGRAVWLGSPDTDLPLPGVLSGLDGWKQLLASAHVFEIVFPPRASKCKGALAPNHSLQALLTFNGSVKYQSDVIIVRTPADANGMVQLLLIRNKVKA